MAVSIQEVLTYLGLLTGPLALALQILTWWLERNPFVVLGLDYETHPQNGRALCELVMRVTNKGRRPLKMAVARFAILKGLSSEASRNVEFPEYLNASVEELSQLQLDKKLVWREPLPQLTAKGTRVAPEEEVTEVRAIHLDRPGVYQVIFVVACERRRRAKGPQTLTRYHTTRLIVIP